MINKIYGVLFFINRRCRFDRTPEKDRHAVADPPVDSSVMIRLRDHLSALKGKTVISLAPPKIRHGKAIAEFNSLYGGNTEQSVGEQALYGIKPGFADSRGQSRDRSLQDASHAVAFARRLFDRSPHLHGSFLIKDRKAAP